MTVRVPALLAAITRTLTLHRLYTLETHGPELTPDEDNPWVRST